MRERERRGAYRLAVYTTGTCKTLCKTFASPRYTEVTPSVILPVSFLFSVDDVHLQMEW